MVGLQYVEGIKPIEPHFPVTPLPSHPQPMQYERKKKRKSVCLSVCQKTAESEEDVDTSDGDEERLQEWLPELILHEEWAVDTKSSKRQYVVKWKQSKETDRVGADTYDKDWPKLVEVWKNTCAEHGDEFPMPRPKVKATARTKFLRRKYKKHSKL
jgi:hypothetical protein